MTPTLPPFHSTPDWALGAFCLLDPTHVISPPNALANQNGAQCNALLTLPAAANIAYGRITASIFAVPATPTWFPRTALAFRCHYFPSWPLSNRYYELLINHDPPWPPGSPRIKLFRVINLFPTLLAQWPFAPPLNAWTTYRLTWIADCTAPAPKPLLITLHHGAPSSWSLIGAHSDPLNLGHDSDRNQVAISLYDDQHWHDDFTLDIWQP